jgi:hypothetical protein
VNLMETYLRAEVVKPLANSFGRLGFKTEARLLKIQGDQLLKLVNKAFDEMPTIDPWEAVGSILGGGMTPTNRENRQQRGTHLKRIGEAEKVMLKTFRKALESLYKTHTDWTRRQQLQATSRMMKAMMEQPKERAQSLLAAAAATSSNANTPAAKK